MRAKQYFYSVEKACIFCCCIKSPMACVIYSLYFVRKYAWKAIANKTSMCTTGFAFGDHSLRRTRNKIPT